MLISNQNRLNEFCAALREGAARGLPLAFDTEFVSEKRYYARLCLVQVGMPTTHATLGELDAAIDPFQVDLAPLLELIADENVEKIVHSGSIDLQILWQNFGIAAKNVFDTQIAAAFLGFGHQIGYADMVRKITGVALSKNFQYSDWSVRPLSAEQIDYALGDVRHLPPVLADLRAQLEKRGRLNWANSEFRRAELKAITTHPDATLYKKLNLSGFNRKQLAVLRELAIVREHIAREIDKPATFVVPDLALIQCAKTPPKNAGDFRAIRGMPGVPQDHIRRLLEAISLGQSVAPELLPPGVAGERPDVRLDAITALMGVVASARAALHDVSRSYLSSRDQLTDLATWWLETKDARRRGEVVATPDLPMLTDWRGELLGADLLRLLDGEMVLAMNGETGLPDLVAA